MNDDDRLVQALTLVRDKLVIALADVERGDHLRAAETLGEAHEGLTAAVTEMRTAA